MTAMLVVFEVNHWTTGATGYYINKSMFKQGPAVAGK